VLGWENEPQERSLWAEKLVQEAVFGNKLPDAVVYSVAMN
jgi:hypothetical protein